MLTEQTAEKPSDYEQKDELITDPLQTCEFFYFPIYITINSLVEYSKVSLIRVTFSGFL
jgi:hypothetical protein